MIKILLMVFSVWVCARMAYAEKLDWQLISGELRDLTAIQVDSNNPAIMYVGTKNGLLKTEDSGNSWKNCLFVKGENKNVNFIVLDMQDSNVIYAGTGNGLYYSLDTGKNWIKIFKGKNYLENNCTDLLKNKSNLYLGTKAGLFFSDDGARSWHRQKTGSFDSQIISIVKLKEVLYLSCTEGVFKTNESGAWEKIFFEIRPQDDILNESMFDEENSEKFKQKIGNLAISNDILYFVCSKGIYKFIQGWDLVSDCGILDARVNFLFDTNTDEIYAVTKSRIFRLNPQNWEELTQGFIVNEIRAIDIDTEGNIYVAADSGLYKSVRLPIPEYKSNFYEFSLESQFPDIKDVQEAAIRYADAEPEKISRWRTQAQKKGLLPKVSIGMNNSSTDRWHWETGSSTKSSDDVLMKGKNSYDWDISLTWDLSELIWTDTQTSIDARSRLMVELRNDILDEVTKLYFERVRICHELSNKSVAGNNKIAEKNIKLRELNAMLDALTGGYFSSQINNFVNRGKKAEIE